MPSLRGLTIFFLSVVVCLALDVHLVTPDSTDPSNPLLWSNSDVWDPSPPSETSNVYIDGSELETTILIDHDVVVKSLHLSNVDLSIGCHSVTITGLIFLSASTVTSSCSSRSTISTNNCEILKPTHLISIDLFILTKADLFGTHLTLTNSKVVIEEDAIFSVTQDPSNPVPLLAWGHGGGGRTGTGNTGTHGLLPVQPSLDFVSLSNCWHSLAITSDGSLYSWGSNSNGQLGLGHTISRDFPTKLDLTKVVQVSAGDAYSLLGIGSTTDQFTPTRISTLSDVVYISAVELHSIAVLSNGEVMAWGVNGRGQLGIGSSGSSVTEPILVPFEHKVRKANAGSESSLFLTESGHLFSSGGNNNDELCVGDDNGRSVPTPILFPKDIPIIQADLSIELDPDTSTFLAAHGDVYTCGDVLGRLTTAVPAHTPGKVEGLGKVAKISGRGTTPLALSTTGGLFDWKRGTLPSIVSETQGLTIGNIFVELISSLFKK
ncbi:hypothetical protein GEMRC1_013074 [Eukaryota sp. GEM-RC1]